MATHNLAAEPVNSGRDSIRIIEGYGYCTEHSGPEAGAGVEVDVGASAGAELLLALELSLVPALLLLAVAVPVSAGALELLFVVDFSSAGLSLLCAVDGEV